ncbi:MAG: 2-succinyl-5-enolpyruvyl-6-hydroxy-3-cyclohexene-carboxylic-acid synthase [Actinomycetota bacterium]
MGWGHEGSVTFVRKPEDVQASFCATLVDEWVRIGLRSAMIAPGSRSTPLAVALVANPAVNVSVFLDERSAAFAALGSGMATGEAALVLCTSGTAATHFHAAVAEADLSGVPMLVITADRPPELRDVGAPQTIDQTDLFGKKVRWFHEPGVAQDAAKASWRSLAARSYAATRSAVPGPVHLNLAFREPLLGEATIEPDDASRVTHTGRSVPSAATVADIVERWSERHGVLVAGRGCASAESMHRLAVALGWPLLAEPRTGAQGNSILHYDSIVRTADSALAPDLVVRFGEAPSSKVLGRFLLESGAEQWHVSAGGRPFDPDSRVSGVVRCDPDALVEAIVGDVRSAAQEWFAQWRRRDESARMAFASLDAVDGAITGPRVARHVVSGLPEGANLVVSSSMPIRDVEWFAGDCSHLRVFASRGANGIDGVIATAIGVATATGLPTGLLIGDVAFVHDASSLAGIKNRDLDLRIVVTDNDGGGIFHHLPQKANLDPAVFEVLFGTPHGTDLELVGRAFGIDTETIDGIAELRDRIARRGPSISIARTDRERDVAEHRRLHASI